MSARRNRRLVVPIWTLLTLSVALPAWTGGFRGGHREAFAPRFEATHDEPRHQPRRSEDAVRRWHEIALSANALDHTPLAPGENRMFGEQFGHLRPSRAFA